MNPVPGTNEELPRGARNLRMCGPPPEARQRILSAARTAWNEPVPEAISWRLPLFRLAACVVAAAAAVCIADLAADRMARGARGPEVAGNRSVTSEEAAPTDPGIEQALPRLSGFAVVVRDTRRSGEQLTAHVRSVGRILCETERGDST